MKVVTFLVRDGYCSGRTVEVDTLPVAIEVAQSTGPGAWIFNLSRQPSLEFPLLNISVDGMALVTNRIAGVLGVACDKVMIQGPEGASSVDMDRSSIRNAETCIYAASASIFGRRWLESLAKAVTPILYERQLRLELLHCMALRLQENESLAELGSIVDMRISEMRFNTVKATKLSFADRG